MSASVAFGSAALICSGVTFFSLKNLILSAPDKLSQSLGSVCPEKVRPPHCAAGAGAGAAVGADVGAGAGATVYPIYVRQD
jgi:hypothetical protein